MSKGDAQGDSFSRFVIVLAKEYFREEIFESELRFEASFLTPIKES